MCSHKCCVFFIMVGLSILGRVYGQEAYGMLDTRGHGQEDKTISINNKIREEQKLRRYSLPPDAMKLLVEKKYAVSVDQRANLVFRTGFFYASTRPKDEQFLRNEALKRLFTQSKILFNETDSIDQANVEFAGVEILKQTLRKNNTAFQGLGTRKFEVRGTLEGYILVREISQE